MSIASASARRFAEIASDPKQLPGVVQALLRLEEETTKERRHAATNILPRNRFLYLAARRYASALRTAEIAATFGFLWRSYHPNKPDRRQAIPRVALIKEGDLIVPHGPGLTHFQGVQVFPIRQVRIELADEEPACRLAWPCFR